MIWIHFNSFLNTFTVSEGQHQNNNYKTHVTGIKRSTKKRKPSHGWSYLTACRLWPRLLSPPASGLCQKQEEPWQESGVWSAGHCRNQTWRQGDRWSEPSLHMSQMFVFFDAGCRLSNVKKKTARNSGKTRLRSVGWSLQVPPRFLPLSLPVDEAKRGVEKPAHLRQRPLSVNAEEEVWGGGVLEGYVHRLSRPTNQIRH